MSVQQPNSGDTLVSISQGIYLIRPAESTPKNDEDPTLILIFAWMGAKMTHIMKYSEKHKETFPSSTQIIVRSDPGFFWVSAKRQADRFASVIEVLEALDCLTPIPNGSSSPQPRAAGLIASPNPTILTHIFSNGGNYNMMTLTNTIKQTRPSVLTLPSALIVDSTPGGGFRMSIRAFVMLFPQKWIRPVARLFIAAMLALSGVVTAVLRKPTFIQMLKKHLASPKVLPWSSERMPRLYIFSKKDELVPYEQVQEHADLSKANGLVVETERYGDSPHVAHSRSDPVRYWGAVRRIWAQRA